MKKQFDQVKQFHEACGIAMPEKPTALSAGPLITNNWLIAPLHELTNEIKEISSHKYKDGDDIGGEVAKRISYMLEELTELAAADGLTEQVDALIDLIYFALGTLTLMGVNPEPIFDIVSRANLGKIQPDGTVLRNEQGKILKPEGWNERHAPESEITAELERQANGY